VVVPIIENDEDDIMDIFECENLFKNKFINRRIGILHGKMKNDDKNRILDDFKNGLLDILISTTVIEVGVNIKEATMMIIMNSERFGISTLHQLRGRVGRGSNQSYCIFMSGKFDKDIMKRLEVMRNSNDGFKIAEEDLKMRGPGDFFGIRQSGEMDFKLADIYQDSEVLIKAAQKARELSEEELAEMSERFPIHFML
jgi:ATP-dependent DNA helicase RecG